jgi:ABC-type multidrug transport system fused ATPase/permease subunit
MAEFKLAMNRI